MKKKTLHISVNMVASSNKKMNSSGFTNFIDINFEGIRDSYGYLVIASEVVDIGNTQFEQSPEATVNHEASVMIW